MSRILIVDDEPGICWALKSALSDEGQTVEVCSSAEEASNMLSQYSPELIILDVRLPGMDGLTATSHFREVIGTSVPIIIMTAFGDLDTAVQAVAAEAFEYLTKPFDLDQMLNAVHRGLKRVRSEAKSNSESADENKQKISSWGTLIGSSASMQEVFKQIALAANSDLPILITGESGTGKELVARAIHQNSSRKDQLFLPVCLAALAPSVIESELFGHVKGAFTDAKEPRTGLLELASSGTVFLDEIADTSLSLQVKLLRVLEQQEINPVGNPQPRNINTRIVTATNKSLPRLIEQNLFREDFFYRLNVFHISLPPLRERTEDIPLLTRLFLHHAGSSQTELPSDVIQELQSRHWIGNVRELRNVIEHASLLARGGPICLHHLPQPALDERKNPVVPNRDEDQPNPELLLREQISIWVRMQMEARLQSSDASEGGMYEQFLHIIEPPLLESVMKSVEGNLSSAAQFLGIHRATLRQKLRKHIKQPEE